MAPSPAFEIRNYPEMCSSYSLEKDLIFMASSERMANAFNEL
jgi:hypothetical protein